MYSAVRQVKTRWKWWVCQAFSPGTNLSRAREHCRVIRHLGYGHEFMSDDAQIDPRYSLHRMPACIHVSSTLHFDGSGLNV